MPQPLHLYVVAIGGYVSSATAWAEEIWQTGFRMLPTLGAAPSSIGTIGSDFDVVAANIDRTEDHWVISGNWTLEGGVNDLDPGDYLNDQLAPALKTWIFATSLASNNVQLRQIKLYPIGAPDGHVIPAPPYLQGSPCVLTFTGTPPTGANSGGMAPPQNSVVASLRTQQIGRRGRGRMYTPPGAPLTGTGADAGVVPSTNRTNIANAYKALLEDSQITAGGLGLRTTPIVTGAPFTDFAVINQVRIGSRVDTQQRRRRAGLETYTSVTVDRDI